VQRGKRNELSSTHSICAIARKIRSMEHEGRRRSNI